MLQTRRLKIKICDMHSTSSCIFKNNLVLIMWPSANQVFRIWGDWQLSQGFDLHAVPGLCMKYKPYKIQCSRARKENFWNYLKLHMELRHTLRTWQVPYTVVYVVCTHTYVYGYACQSWGMDTIQHQTKQWLERRWLECRWLECRWLEYRWLGHKWNRKSELGA